MCLASHKVTPHMGMQKIFEISVQIHGGVQSGIQNAKKQKGQS